MKIFLLLFASVVALAAQTLTPSSSAAAAPGLSYPVIISLSGAPTTGPAIVAAQFAISIPTGWKITSVSAPAGKIPQCASLVNPASAVPGSCAVYELDQTVPFANGPLMTVTFLIPTTATTGTAVINLSALAVVDATGALNGAAAGNNLNVPVVNYDLNGDGQVSGADIISEVNQVLGATPCTNGDLNGDGQCRLNDLFLMIQAWISYGSHATP